MVLLKTVKPYLLKTVKVLINYRTIWTIATLWLKSGYTNTRVLIISD